MVDSWNAAVLNETAQRNSGGGGTSVVANPEGSATEHLSKVGIGNTIYSLGTGQTVLYNPETPTSISSTASDVELNAVITGYDFILLTLGNNSGRSIAVSTPEDLESTDGGSFSSGSSEEWEYSVGADHKTLSIKCGGSNRKLHKVVGIKL